MVRRKERTIYENDGTKVMVNDESVMAKDTMSVQKAPAKLPQEIDTVDFFDAMVGYTMPRFNLNLDVDEEGECVICGKKTAYAKRKLCVDCMEKYAVDLYPKAKAAIQTGKYTIKL